MTFWIVAGLAAFILGLSKGGMPVVAILSVPLLSLLMDPALAAGLLLPLYLIADCYALYLFRKAFSVRNLKILIPAVGVGVLIATFAVSSVPADGVKLLLALIGFSYLFNTIRKRLAQREVEPKPADVPRGLFWGTLAGITSYIAHSGGPPYQAYVLPQKLEKMSYLGTTAIVFACLNWMKVPAYIYVGQMNWQSIQQALWLAPFALLGAWSGAQISRLLPEKIFFLLIEIALGLVSVKLLFEVLFQ
ncbi:MAG: sulfite exporter TauE/SafE family protein [Rhizobiales bacterium]|nr:sulfite exporter TauE/SafE family protein [Hyphomicrobiales bacterium]MBO6699267.1 sulfite exporter TauE/SafE family protein [Hyphomicrobiales bacterium]MBO6736805.1 sulfite exporter TauE/SafE family protein [Hyphomicrobiales bacterium]MBO6912121.1 sulfite exporter TauE/SafE family protein [Hyphomicrobiales bacterium]MBO6954511.1 sulfite exporter TauE/SafE family protein [Hyphomicrobiales bacterium]